MWCADSLTCATSAWTSTHVGLQEVAVCFDGKLMRGNRAQKVNSSSYQAFDSPSYPKLATLGIDVEWNDNYLLRPEGGYRPRFKVRRGCGGVRFSRCCGVLLHHAVPIDSQQLS